MRRSWILSFIVLIVLFVFLDLFVAEHLHAVFPWSHVAGFFSLFGLLGCLALIGFAKLIGHYWLQKKEDYYDRDDGNK